MKKFIIIALLALPFIGYSQCSSQKDEFSGEQLYSYIMQPGGVKNLGTYLTFQKIDQSLTINFTYVIPNAQSNIDSMQKSELKIKLDDGQFIDFKANGNSKVSYALNNLFYIFQADLTKSDFDKIINLKINVLRFIVDSRTIDIKFLQTDKNKIDKAANCLQ
jgi:hypothetical protein